MEFSLFADHFRDDCGILQLMSDLGEGVNGTDDIHMLGGGNPARIPEMESVFRREMLALMERGREFESMVGNYDDPGGNRDFCQALSELLRNRFGWPVSADNIAVTNGSQASFGILFNTFSGRYRDGSTRKILLPVTPEYIGYSDVGIGETDIFVSKQPLIETHGESSFKYRIDFENIAVGKDIGAICVSRPTNPSGNVITDNELEKLRQLAKQNHIPLIIDGAYGQPFPGIIFSDTNPVWDTNTILCLSLSKLGLPGVRAGIVVADTPVIQLITGSNAIHTLSPGRFGPTLVSELVRSSEIIRLSEEVVRPYYQQRSVQAIDLTKQAMSGLPVRIHESEGAMFLWMWFPDLPISSQVLYQRLKARGVFVIAGEHFFPGLKTNPEAPWSHRHECIRVSYAADEADVRAGISIIAEEVRAAYRASDAA